MNKFLLCFMSLILLPIALIGCKKDVVVEGTSDQITVSPVLGGQYKSLPSATGSRTDVSATDEIGVFVAQYRNGTQTALAATGNVYDNVKVINGTATPQMFYPSRRDAIDVYAYLPYKSSVTNPTSVPLKVNATQNATTLLADDFLRGVKKQTAPATAQPANVAVELSHAMSLIKINIIAPASLGGKNISSIKTVLKGFNTSANYNIGTDAFSTVATPKDITMYQSGAATADDTEFKYPYEAIMIPQTGATSFLEVTATFADNSTQNFTCKLTAAPVLKSGFMHKFNITMSGYGELTVTDHSILPWNNVTLVGEITNVSNKLHFVLFEKSYYKNLAKVEMTIGGKVYTSDLTAPKPADNNSIIAYYDANFPDIPKSTDVPAKYPFTISKMSFVDALGNKYNEAGDLTITQSGDVNIAVMNFVSMIVDNATLKAWTEKALDGQFSKVYNQLRFVVFQNNRWGNSISTFKTAKLTIGGVDYTLNLTADAANSNKLVAYYDAWLPDASAPTKIPAKYPFAIDKIVFADNLSNQYPVDEGHESTITSGGLVNIAIIENASAIVDANTLKSWVDNILYGTTENFEFKFTILDPGTSYSGITGVKITVADVVYTCSAAKFVASASNNSLMAVYNAKLPDDDGSKPGLPGVITNLAFINAKGEVVQQFSCSVEYTRAGTNDIAVVKGAAFSVPNNNIGLWTNNGVLALLPSGFVMNKLTLNFWDLSYASSISTVYVETDKGNFSCSLNLGRLIRNYENINDYDNKVKFDLLIPGDNNSAPTGYPYTITKLRFAGNGVSVDEITSVSVTGNSGTDASINIGIYQK